MVIKMKKNIVIWGTVLILIAIAIYVTNKNSLSSSNTNTSDSATQSQISNSNSTFNQDNSILIDTNSRQKAIDFTLTDLNGNKVLLKDLQGKNVYINFWTTWCTWCVKEMPDIEKVYQEYKGKNIVILAVNMGENKITVSDFFKKNNYHFTALLDIDQSVSQQYNITSIPVSIFIDKSGKIAQKRVGAMTEDEMKAVIDELIK
jgi:thiol-disulfide isomerase/thioredoxin